MSTEQPQPQQAVQLSPEQQSQQQQAERQPQQQHQHDQQQSQLQPHLLQQSPGGRKPSAVQAVVAGSGGSGIGADGGMLSSSDLNALMLLFYSRSLSDLDPGLAALTSGMNVSWDRALNVLVSRFGTLVREVMDAGETRHVLIFNPNHHDMLVHVWHEGKTDKVALNAVRRELEMVSPAEPAQAAAEAERTLRAVEREHVENVVNVLLGHLWTELLM